jgi:hypothetical protein
MLLKKDSDPWRLFVNIFCPEDESNILFQKFLYPLTRMHDEPSRP